MDYHVLILGRIREAYDRGASMDDAISYGIKRTAGVVTSAAIVMVGVFSIFAVLSMLMFKQFGVGLAVAILIDATIVRGVLLPASMKLLGDWNWYLPTWLEWLLDSTTTRPRPRPRSRRRPSPRRPRTMHEPRSAREEGPGFVCREAGPASEILIARRPPSSGIHVDRTGGER